MIHALHHSIPPGSGLATVDTVHDLASFTDPDRHDHVRVTLPDVGGAAAACTEPPDAAGAARALRAPLESPAVAGVGRSREFIRRHQAGARVVACRRAVEG
ncbi:hypothetical protein GCM10010116_37200 [Microbispora rosea subsp. aerata]|nr:hypothetical protein [Microbispora rosea]GGO18451.1 hypothetical protein GCM10010116_37200 [Microbispora rosea subsp. aerata]GIH56645.1 hypothetical protein Mro02_35590 [Microbispora rosea subsp. aerata]GLJ82017.1 hypothetical protein GCM10017588_07420 [Microbispora rosea subsp. aerata]